MIRKISLFVLIVTMVAAHYGTFARAAEQKTEALPAADQKMLFLCYWELNENMDSMHHIMIAMLLTESGLFPPPGVEIIRWDKTPGNWGVTVFKAESVEAAASLVGMWRLAAPGFFKKVKMSPAMPIPDSAAQGARLYKSIKEAEAKMMEKAKTVPNQ